MRKVKVAILKTDGTRTMQEVDKSRLFEQLYPMIGTDVIEPMYLHRLVMLMDEEGTMKNKAHNAEASALAGRRIVGDVALICRKDFED